MNISEKRIKSKVEKDARVLVVENIKYPVFEDKENEKLIKRMNDFYRTVAEKYSGYGNKILPKRILRARKKMRIPLYLAMNFTASFCHNGVVSVILDLTYSEGKNVKMRRFSQMWSTVTANMIATGDFIKRNASSNRYVKNIVLNTAKENAENPAFGYYGDYLVRLNKAFSLDNCFALPTGVAFFVQAGTVCPERYGASTFVIPYSRLEDIVNVQFLPNNGEKCDISENNVNKV